MANICKSAYCHCWPVGGQLPALSKLAAVSPGSAHLHVVLWSRQEAVAEAADVGQQRLQQPAVGHVGVWGVEGGIGRGIEPKKDRVTERILAVSV